jgi:tungstate transport system ATP-binding protein
LAEIASQSSRTLSGGQSQLVALARALAIESDALLLDEPTAHLDPARVALVEQVVGETAARRAMTVVWATHNLFQARRVAQRVAVLLDGELVEVDAASDVFDSPRDPRAAAFVQGIMIF